MAYDLNTASSNMSVTTINDLPDELLIHVLRQVPVENRVSIRAVSRKWYSIILDIGYHVEPLLIGENYKVPIYSDQPAIKVNHALPWMLLRMPKEDGDSLEENNALHYTIRTKELNHAVLFQRRSEFITSPPVSMAQVNLYDPRPRLRKGRQAPLIKVNERLTTTGPSSSRGEGIRIRDILHLFDQARAMDGVHENPRARIVPSMLARLSHLHGRTRVLAKIDRPPATEVSPMFLTCKSKGCCAESVVQTASMEIWAEAGVDS